MTGGINTKAWVISLPNADARRAQFSSGAAAASRPWSFFDAHSGLSPDLQYDDGASLRRHGRTLGAGELGVYSSHFGTWKWLVESSYDQMIVMEDDVVVDWPFLDRLSTWDFKSKNIEYLRLFSKVPGKWRYVATPFFDKYHHLIHFTSFVLGAQGYLLTKAGARKLLDRGSRVTAPVDAYMDRSWVHGVANLAIYPFPLYERSQPSSIGDGRLSRGELPSRIKSRFFLSKLNDRLHVWSRRFGIDPPDVRSLRKRLNNSPRDEL